MGEQSEGGGGTEMMCVYFKGQIVKVVGKGKGWRMTSDEAG